MATQQAIFTNEGEVFFANALFKNDASSTRSAGLELMLFTNTTVSETTTYAQLTKPTGGNYANKPLNDDNWTVSNGGVSYGSQNFTPLGSAYAEAIQGAAIVTTGASPKVLFIVTDPSAPVSLTAGTPYIVAVNVACAAITKGNTEFFLNLLLKNLKSLRGTDMKAVLITNTADVNAKLETELHKPTSAGGYLDIGIQDSTWTINTTSGDAVATTSTSLTFTPTTTLFSADIVGYAIVAGGHVVAVELDPTQPVSIPLNTPYIVTPSIKVM